jgi:hypothetical protein
VDEDMNAVWKRIDEHGSLIQQIRIEQAASEAKTDTRLHHLESGQQEIIKTLAKIDHKIDANTASLNQTQGGIRAGKWLAGIIATGVGLVIAGMSYFKG